MATHYNGSKGLIEIATMPLRYASNALNKLQMYREDDSRDAEIEALTAHVAKLAAQLDDPAVAEGPVL